MMRLDLEEYDFTIEYIPGKGNVGPDALSRIVTTSDELKQISILRVNTRSMTQNLPNKVRNISQISSSVPR